MAYLTAGKSGGFWRRQAGYVARGGFKLIGFAISVILAAGIVVWGNDVVSQDGLEIPVIKPSSAMWRIQPEDPGGRVAMNTGYTVNRLLIDQSEPPDIENVKLAAPPVELLDEDLSAREFAANRVGSSTKPDSNGDQRPVGAVLPLFAENSMQGSGQQIDPTQIRSGEFLVQIGAYASKSDAENQWRRTRFSVPDDLGQHDWLVQYAKFGGDEFYRLRLRGFQNWEDASTFCDRLAARGIECSPVVAG